MTFEISALTTAGYSEWSDSNGQIRSHYSNIAKVAGPFGPAGLMERWGGDQRQTGLDVFAFYLDPKA